MMQITRGDFITQPYKNMSYKKLYKWAEYVLLENKKPVFKSIRAINALIVNRQQYGHDYNVLIVGLRGSGKSTFAYRLTKEHNNFIWDESGRVGSFKYQNHVVYSGVYEEYLEKYNMLKKGQAISLDEAGKLFFKMDFGQKDVKSIQKMWIGDIRKDKKPVHIFCIPNPQDLMKFWRQFETNMIILCMPRWWYTHPSAYLFELSNVLAGEEKEKLIQRLSRISGSPKQIKKKLMRDKYFSGFITYKDFTDKEREIYLRTRESELEKYNQIYEQKKKVLSIKAIKRYIALFKLIDYLKDKNKTKHGIATIMGKILDRETIYKMMQLSEKYVELQHTTKVENIELIKKLMDNIGYTD